MGRARELGRNDLICSYYTLAGQMTGPGSPSPVPFADRVAAVASAGYAGIGMMAYDYDAAVATGLSDADLRAIVDDHGVCVAEIEFLSGWWLTDERGRDADAVLATLLHMAEVFESRHLSVLAGAESLAPVDIESSAARFAELCDRAADQGLLVAMEFMDISTIKDIGTAGQIVKMADRRNGGVVLDSYHYFRSASTEADLRDLGADRINCIQLADAAGTGKWSREETTERRLPPGAGDFDLVGLIRIIDDMGVTTPPSVEILSTVQWAKPLEEQASSSFTATRSMLDQARLA